MPARHLVEEIKNNNILLENKLKYINKIIKNMKK